MKVLRETHGEDNTVKFLIGLDDLQSVEALNMCDKELRLTYHSTVCVYRSMPRRMKNGWRLSPTQKLRSAGDEAAEAFAEAAKSKTRIRYMLIRGMTIRTLILTR